MSTNAIGLDFETYGAVSLPDHGLYRYVNDPSFRVLLASVTVLDVSTGIFLTETVDFVELNYDKAINKLRTMLGSSNIVAHNAGFEHAVLERLGLQYPVDKFIDSAVIAAALGADRHLEMAGPQLLNIDKLDVGKQLIQLFCVPQKDQEGPDFDVTLRERYPVEWAQFIEYCERDSQLGLKIALLASYGNNDYGLYTAKEQRYSRLTMRMNQIGWPVDVPSVQRMNQLYQSNLLAAEMAFRSRFDAQHLNFNSHKQLKEWCAARGFKAVSFDEAHVTKYLALMEKRQQNQGLTEGQTQVKALLELKRALGGSSLKKLKTILDTVEGGRLRDQYVHCGAVASFRTTGRSVQMQNLKRLGKPTPPDDWYMLTNEELATNIRQVFGGDPNKEIIVGDFASVESRGLAWFAGAQWKLDAYAAGEDMYKTLASTMFGMPYYAIDKESMERRAGKVGELSCGYQASGVAVQKFAEGMGISMNEAEAADLVWKWRTANPETVALWQQLQEMLEEMYTHSRKRAADLTLKIDNTYFLRFEKVSAPQSLHKQLGSPVYSLQVALYAGSMQLFRRVFHGIHTIGRELCYYKPTSRKTGDLWAAGYVDPKTKQWRNYTLYGGKLAGILTQSLCREIFFEVLQRVNSRLTLTGVEVIGQFHDEIVLELDKRASSVSVETMKQLLKDEMSRTSLPGFPLAAEVNSAYRYIK